VPGTPGEPVLRAAQAAGQDRHHDLGQEADRSAPGREHDGEFQAPGNGSADNAAEIGQFSVVSSQFSVNLLLYTLVILSEAKDLLSAALLKLLCHSLRSPPNPNSPPSTKPKNSPVVTNWSA